MRRNTLAAAILWAAVGFAATGAVVFSSGIHADDTPKRGDARGTISTARYTIAWQMNEQTKQTELVISNLTAESLKLTWTQRLQSTGKVSPLARSLPQMKDVSSEVLTLDVPGRATTRQLVSVPAVQEPAAQQDANAKALSLVTRERRQVVVELAGQSLIVPVIDQPLQQLAQQ